MAAKNAYKDKKEEEPEKVVDEKGPVKKTRKPKNVKNPDRNERLIKVLGLVTIIFSAYLVIAFSSFLFTWQEDQDKVASGGLGILFDNEVQVNNWLGKLGALISHLFIHKWFGISSFLFIPWFFVLGVRIMLKIELLPLKKLTLYTGLSIVWISVCLGFIFGTPYDFLGGAFGYHVNGWIESALGAVGTGILIFASLAGTIIVLFNPPFEKWFSSAEHPDSEEGADATEEDSSAENTIVTPVEPEEEAAAEEESISLDINEPVEEADGTTETPEEEQELELEPSTSDSTEEEKEFSVEVANTAEKILTEEELDSKLHEFGEYDPTLDLSSYQLPPIDLLVEHGRSEISVNKEELEANKNKIVNTLANYNIKIAKIKATIGPTVTLYEIVPAAGVRISKIKNLEDDIALSLSALGIRIIAPIPGRGTIGIEVPNLNPDIVSMRSILASDKFQNSDYALPIALGKTISNEIFIADLAKMPHLLMAGATGQGKSVGLNAILASLLYKKHPSQIKFVLVDPKKVELTLFNKIERHFLAKLPGTEEAIITDTQKVVHTLNSLCIEMDDRYDLLKDASVRNIAEYNAKFIARKLNPENGHRYLPYIVLVVDEFADLIMTAGKEVETPIARLAQLARAIGIHLIIATQRPSVNIITGTIKANFPARIAFRVTSKIDSRTILDEGGADQLIGRGDMLLSTGNEVIRIQCAFVDTPEIEKVTAFIGDQRAYPEAYLLPEYIEESSGAGDLDDSERDVLFADAAHVIVTHQQGSASLLQRKLKLGYNRAGRLVDQLEAAGIIGPFKGSKAREVLIPDTISLEQFLNNQESNTNNF